MNVIWNASRWLAAAFLLLLLLAAASRAEVGDPTLRTNHPQYPGEGAFQTVEDCVRFATAGKDSAQDKALALYQWLLTHQWHLMSPQEWCVPGRVPDTARPGDYELVVFDANRARFSYGYGLCGTVHSWNEPYWRALGMPARRRAFPGHVNSEIYYDGAWHAFDTDMAGLLFRRDGVVAGYDDIVADPSLVDSVRPPIPHYPFAWPSDFETMKRGWQEVAAGGNWYKMYNSGYAAHPAIVHLRSGEVFTRWYDRDHYGGPSKRRFWHHLPGGPQRNWTFFDNGQPRHDGATSNARGNASYSNGEFVYEPDLASGKFREGVVGETGDVAFRASSPKLYSRQANPVSITFRHFSPYVICGDPVNDANPMSAPATDGLVIDGTGVGEVQVDVSANEGQAWHPVGTLKAGRPLDVTDLVKGRYGWLVRLSWQGEAGVDALRFTTVTQVCQSIYPRLKANGSRVTYQAASRAVVAVLPDFRPESSVEAFEAVELRSANVRYRGRSGESRLAYETTDNKPGHVVFPVAAPGKLSKVHAAVRYQLRVPPPANADYRLEISTDAGRTWRMMTRAEIPVDNEFSSGWLAGSVDVSADNVQRALVRVHLDAGGHRTGIIDAQFYGVYRTGPPQAATVDYGWLEDGALKTHRESIPALVEQHDFQVPTSANVQDSFVRIRVP